MENLYFTNICAVGLVGADPAEDIAALQKLLADNSDLINSREVKGFGCTALGIACWRRRLHIVRFLLENGADANRLGSAGSTPLILAVRSPDDFENQGNENNRQYGIVRLLLEYKADPNMAAATDLVTNEEPAQLAFTPMRFAIKIGDLNIVQILLHHGAERNTALGLACFQRRLDIVRFLLENGADVNQPNEDGRTPLNTALMSTTHNDNGIPHELIHLLLEYNADPNMAIQSEEGISYEISPMFRAIKYGDLRILQMLLHAGATDTRDMACLRVACAKKRPDMVEHLLNSPNLAEQDENLPQNSFRNRAFCAAGFFLLLDNVPAAFDIFRKMQSQGLSLDGDFITPFIPPTTTLLHQCLKLTSNDSRAQAVHRALEMGVDPTYPIPVDEVGATGHIFPLTYALLGEPGGMDLSSIFLLYRACSGLGQLHF